MRDRSNEKPLFLPRTKNEEKTKRGGRRAGTGEKAAPSESRAGTGCGGRRVSGNENGERDGPIALSG